ncbi:MAG: amidohydrolase family protein [Gemmatimonadaceae bacterium]
MEEGRIVYVGARSAAPPAREVVQLGHAFLVPGLVNAHTHLELTAMRGYLDDTETSFRSWLRRLTAARGKVLDEAALLASARFGIAEGLLAGITTYADTSASGSVVMALTSMRVRGISYQEVFGPHPAQCTESLDELRRRLAHLARVSTPLVRLGVSPHAPYTVSDELYRAVARYAAEERLPVAMHIAESHAEMEFVTAGRGPFAEGWSARGIPVTTRAASAVALLEQTGVLATRPLLIHCVHLTSNDIATIARFRCSVVHCPASNAKLAHGVAPLAQLLDVVPVGLGSDSVASSNRMDMLDEARLALLMARASRGATLDAQNGLQLATIGGARALGLESEVGSLERGKAADLAAFPVDPARDEPVYHPATALVFGSAGRRASMVAVAGEELVRGGHLLANLAPDIAALHGVSERLAQFALEANAIGGLDFTVVPQT